MPMKLFPRSFRRVSALVAGVVLAGSVAVVGATPASASGYSSYIYTQPGRPVANAMCVLDFACTYGSIIQIPNKNPATKAEMLCWFDNNTVDGNYSTNKWFAVLISGQPGEYIMPASYVYYQTNVSECAGW